MSKGSCAGVEGLKGCEDPTDPRGWVAFSCITEALAEIECVVGANASGNAHDHFAEMTTQADEGAGTGYSPVHHFPERWIAIVYFRWLPFQGLARTSGTNPSIIIRDRSGH